jgi:hypothetical protein
MGTSSATAWVSTNGLFLGLRASQLNPTGGTIPSAFVDCVGIGHDPGDANLQFMYNDASSTCTKVDLGSNFVLATKKAFDLEIYAAPNSSTIYYKVTNVLSGNTASGNVSTNVPTVNTGLNWIAYSTNGVVATASSLAVGYQYIES